MPRKARCRSFDFYPDDFLNDPAVLVMTAEQVGVYVRLLCSLWGLSEPGVAPDSDSVLRGLARASEGEWERSKAAVSACFVVRGGKWTQRRMVQVFTAQAKRIERRTLAGINGGKASARKRLSTSASTNVQPSSASTSSSVKQTPKISPTQLGLAVVPVEETRAQWQEGFDWFWEQYPRKVGKIEAAEAYASIRPRTQETFDALMRGLAWTIKHEWADRPKDKIPHAVRFIKKRRYDDAQENGKPPNP